MGTSIGMGMGKGMCIGMGNGIDTSMGMGIGISIVICITRITLSHQIRKHWHRHGRIGMSKGMDRHGHSYIYKKRRISICAGA
jgi:hypothetical protein